MGDPLLSKQSNVNIAALGVRVRRGFARIEIPCTHHRREGCAHDRRRYAGLAGNVFGAAGPALPGLGGENSHGVDDRIAAVEVGESFVDEGLGERTRGGEYASDFLEIVAGEQVGWVSSFGQPGVEGVEPV